MTQTSKFTAAQWDYHFQQSSKRAKLGLRDPFGADFGTIAGNHTVAELKDLITNFDSELAATQKNFDGFKGTWASAGDTSALTDWQNDWNALNARYQKARSGAESAISLSKINPLPDSAISAESDYQKVLKAFKQVDGTITKGDYDDLEKRLHDSIQYMTGNNDWSGGTVQPTATDIDQKVFSWTSPIDVLAYMKGDQKIPPGSTGLEFLKWLYDHRVAVGIGLGAIILLPYFTALTAPARALKAAIPAV